VHSATSGRAGARLRQMGRTADSRSISPEFGGAGLQDLGDARWSVLLSLADERRKTRSRPRRLRSQAFRVVTPQGRAGALGRNRKGCWSRPRNRLISATAWAQRRRHGALVEIAENAGVTRARHAGPHEFPSRHPPTTFRRDAVLGKADVIPRIGDERPVRRPSTRSRRIVRTRPGHQKEAKTITLGGATSK